ncbi:hypothetical protein [Pengzhenrongella sp.]|uniref:hypothetical protein n=1 Tax=Pengzhenrongella sp. TaxID=2888820 RepID=UPI002F93B981
MVLTINAPEAAVVVPWSARRQAARNVRRGILPEDEPDRSRTIEQARNSVRLRWLALIFAINGPLQLLNAVSDHHVEIWFRSMFAVLGLCTFSLAVAIFLRVRGARAVLARVEIGNRGPDSGRRA